MTFMLSGSLNDSRDVDFLSAGAGGQGGGEAGITQNFLEAGFLLKLV
jgi:hypothetical protein